MRVFQVSPDSLAAMFEAQQAKENAAHGCACGSCERQPVDEAGDEFDGISLFDLLALLAEDGPELESKEEEDDFEFDVDFEPDFELSPGPDLLSRAEQLDMLFKMSLGLVAITGLLASLIGEEI